MFLSTDLQELHSLHQASQTLVRFNSNFIGSIVRKYNWLVSPAVKLLGASSLVLKRCMNNMWVVCTGS
jgi:hypothetical protein